MLRTVGSLLLMAIRATWVSPHREHRGRLATFEPNLYLYDNYPGGIGQSQPLYRLTSRMLSAAAELIARCECEWGCPSCVGPVGEIGEKGKQAAARFLAELMRPAGA